MIFVTGLCLGLAAATLRSFVAIAAVGVLTLVAFSFALLTSSESAPLLALAISVFGYNIGLASMVLLAFIDRNQQAAEPLTVSWHCTMLTQSDEDWS